MCVLLYVCTFQQRKEFIEFYGVAEVAIIQRKFNLVSMQMRNESLKKFKHCSIGLFSKIDFWSLLGYMWVFGGNRGVGEGRICE
jgi:hypothetical protein